MKTFDKILIIVGVIIVLIAGLCVGRYIIPLHQKPTIETKETIVKDTVTVEKTIRIFEKSKPEIIRDTNKTICSIVDSIKGTQNEVAYKIKHTTKNLGEYFSDWEIELKPYFKTITEYITKDSIQTVVNTEYIPKPFLLDVWFYVSVFLAGLAVTLSL